MKNKIDKIIVAILSILLSLYPILGGGYRTYKSHLLFYISLVLMILLLLNHFIQKKKIKIHLGIVLLFFLWIIYYTHAFLNIQKTTMREFILLFMSFLFFSILFYNKMNEKNMYIWKYSILFSGILSILLSTIGILNLKWFPFPIRYTDFYISSVNRLYGTFVYPNAYGLFMLVCYFISLEFIRKNKNNIFEILGYLYLLYFAITISKIGFLLFILFYFIYLYFYKKEKLSIITPHLISLCIPTFIGVESFRKLSFTSNITLYIITILLLILLYFTLKKLCEKKLGIFIILIIIIMTMIIPIPKTLKIKNKGTLKYIVLTDFMNLKKNHTYRLEIPMKQKGIYRNSKIRITKVVTKDNVANYLPVAILDIKDGKQKIIYDLKTEEDFAYYYIELLHTSSYNTYEIDPVVLIDQKNKKQKMYPLDYYIMPYVYAFQKEQMKYDKGSALGRASIYKDCLHLTKNHILFGYGYGAFEEAFYKYHLKGQTIEEHSFLFKLLLEVGILGLLLYSLLILDLFLISLRIYKNKKNISIILLCMILFLSSCIDFTFSYSQLFLLFIVLSTYIHHMYDKQQKDRVLFIASAGGHLTELLHLKKLFSKYQSVLVTEKNHISENLNVPIEVEYLKYSSRYYLIHYILTVPFNIIKSLYLFIKYNPDVIYTTGAHTSVCMCYLGFLFGRKIIFIEVYDRVTPTLSGKLVYKIATKFIVQRKELCKYYKKAIYMEGIYE